MTLIVMTRTIKVIGCTLELGTQECTTVLQCATAAAAAPAAPAAMRLIFICIKLTHFRNLLT